VSGSTRRVFSEVTQEAMLDKLAIKDVALVTKESCA